MTAEFQKDARGFCPIMSIGSIQRNARPFLCCGSQCLWWIVTSEKEGHCILNDTVRVYDPFIKKMEADEAERLRAKQEAELEKGDEDRCRL